MEMASPSMRADWASPSAWTREKIECTRERGERGEIQLERPLVCLNPTRIKFPMPPIQIRQDELGSNIKPKTLSLLSAVRPLSKVLKVDIYKR